MAESERDRLASAVLLVLRDQKSDCQRLKAVKILNNLNRLNVLRETRRPPRGGYF